MNHDRASSIRNGLLCGLAAYGLWGVIPLYFKFLQAVPPYEMLAHRIVWSFVVLAAVVVASGRWPAFVRAIASRQVALTLLATAVLISINWGTYIYAVAQGQVVQASLGYFITPLMNVLLGMLVLGERLRPLQWISVALAGIGVLLLTFAAGSFPYISLTLAISFGVYALLRKTVRAEALVGLLFETACVAPLAAAYLVWLQMQGTHTWENLPQPHLLVLLASGFITTAPLLLFVIAARRLPLTTMGFLQYLAPTLQFLLAVLAFGEPFGGAQWISFAWIWAAVGVYLADSIAARSTAAGADREPDRVSPTPSQQAEPATEFAET